MSGRNPPPDPSSSAVKRSSRTPVRNPKFADFVQSLPSGSSSKSGTSSPLQKLKSESIEKNDDNAQLGITKEQPCIDDGSNIASEGSEKQCVHEIQHPNTETDEADRLPNTLRRCDVDLMNISSQRRLGLAVKMLLNRLDYDDG